MDIEDYLPLKIFTKSKPIARSNMRLYKEVKLVAGKDNQWFTADDAVYTYYTYEYDNAGRITKKASFKCSPDNIPYTADDELYHYEVFVYDGNGKTVGEITYDGKGSDGQWFTADDIEEYHFTYEYGLFGEKTKAIVYTNRSVQERCLHYGYSLGRIVKEVEYRNKGRDNKWCTFDDKIYLYHKFKYNEHGKLTRTLEYNNKGRDNLWFTQDDSLDAYNVRIFNKEGLRNETIKYIAKGPDDKWFTDDDVIQYYILYYYVKAS